MTPDDARVALNRVLYKLAREVDQAKIDDMERRILALEPIAYPAPEPTKAQLADMLS